jgi:hypothetical protein
MHWTVERLYLQHKIFHVVFFDHVELLVTRGQMRTQLLLDSANAIQRDHVITDRGLEGFEG